MLLYPLLIALLAIGLVLEVSKARPRLRGFLGIVLGFLAVLLLWKLGVV